MKNKCPKCKSENIIDQRWLYPMSPNVCHDCGLKWEPTLFVRIFLPSWVLVLALAVVSGATKNEFWKSDLGAVVLFSYLALLLIAPTVGWYLHPYKVWGGSELVRKLVNYGCLGSMLVVAVFYYTNA